MKIFATRGRRLAASGPGVGGSQSLDVRSGLPHRFEAVGEALTSGSDVLDACSVAGQDLARDGASVEETLEGLRATWQQVAGTDPAYEVVAALLTAWSETTLGYLHQLSCEDPLTGLASQAHLRSRLSELYRLDDTADAAGSERRRPRAGRVRDAVRRRPVGGAGRPLHPRDAAGAGRGARAHGVRPRRDGRAPRHAPGGGADPPRRPARRRVRVLRTLLDGVAVGGGADASCGSGSRGCPPRTGAPGCCSTSSPAAERTPSPGSARVGHMCGRYASSRQLRGPRRGVRGRREPDRRAPGAPTTTSRRPRRSTPSSSARPREESARAGPAPAAGAHLGPRPVVGQGPLHRQPDDQRADGDRRREARLPQGVRHPARAAAGRRLLRVVPHLADQRQGQAGQAALLHPAQGRRGPRDGRSLRDLARPDEGRGRP